MSEPLVFHLDADPGRSHALDQCFYGLANLERDKRYIVSVEVWNPKLPKNFMARLKIPVRHLAKHCGWSYPEMNEYVRKKYYPTTLKTVGRETVEVPKRSNELSPEEAREIEVHLYDFAQELHCPIPVPKKWTA